MQKVSETSEDIILSESAAGLRRGENPDLTLYVISLFGIRNAAGDLLNGDALLVRPRGTADITMLAAILGCAEEHVLKLIAGTGTWTIRPITQIDGHRVRFERI